MSTSPLQKALEQAPVEDRAAPPRPEHEYFVFRVGGFAMGVPSEQVREVARLGTLTPLPRAPPFVLGAVGHRGEVFPLIDLLRFLGQGEARVLPRARLFVTVTEGSIVGFVVEDVVGLWRIADGDLLPPPSGPGFGLSHVTGVCQPGELGALMLLDFAGIVAAARHRLVGR